MTEIVKAKRNAIAEYEFTPKAIATMAKEYMTLKVIEGDTGSYKIARSALTTVVTTRTGTDKHRKKLGEEARTWIKEVNTAASELLAPLIEVEEHLREELGREDGRKAAIKAEKEARELKRVSEIKEKIATITSFSASLNWQLTVDELNVILGNLEVLVITPDEYMEFAAEANQAKHDVQIALHKAIGAREVFDKEEAARKAEDERLAAERAEIDRIKAEQEAKQKEIDDEQAKVNAEKDRLEREEAERKAHERGVAEAEEIARKAKEEAEEKLKQAAREQEEKEKAEAEAKYEQEARQEAMKSDKEKLLDWLKGLQLTTLPPFVEDKALLSISQDIGVRFAAVIKNGKKEIIEA